MLVNLHVKNLALIEEENVDFEEGNWRQASLIIPIPAGIIPLRYQIQTGKIWFGVMLLGKTIFYR